MNGGKLLKLPYNIYLLLESGFIELEEIDE